jgi:co-chaperonin GroES (HSP10)
MKAGTNIIDPRKIVPARGYFLFLTEERKAEKNGIKVAFLDEQTNDWGKCVKMGEILGYDPGFREGDRVMVAKLSGRKQFDKKGREYLVLPFSEVSAYVPSNKQVSGQAG